MKCERLGGKCLLRCVNDLDFLDSESAPVVKRLENEHGFEVEGFQFFLQKIVEETENRQ